MQQAADLSGEALRDPLHATYQRPIKLAAKEQDIYSSSWWGPKERLNAEFTVMFMVRYGVRHTACCQLIIPHSSSRSHIFLSAEGTFFFFCTKAFRSKHS